MLDTDVLWRFLFLWLVIVPTPGANSLMVTHVSLTRPAAHVAFALLGNICGIVLLGACALLGWAALLDVFPWLRVAVHVLGGAYLIYFGVRLLQRAAQPVASGDMSGDGRIDRTEPLKALALGFATSLSNAQAILFITGIFAVSGVLAANQATGLAVLAIMALCNVSYLGFLGWMFRRPAIRAGYQRFRHWFEGAIGLLFTAFGGRLIVREMLQ